MSIVTKAAVTNFKHVSELSRVAYITYAVALRTCTYTAGYSSGTTKLKPVDCMAGSYLDTIATLICI